MTVYFVDTENVADDWIALLPYIRRSDRILLFFTPKSAGSTSLFALMCAQKKHARVEYILCRNGTPNALDFQIVTELGRRVTLRPQDRCVIVSRDAGFAPAISYWQDRGISIEQAKPPAGAETAEEKRAFEMLTIGATAPNDSNKTAAKNTPAKATGSDNGLSKSEISCRDACIAKLRQAEFPESRQNGVVTLMIQALRAPRELQLAKMRTAVLAQYDASAWAKMRSAAAWLAVYGPYPVAVSPSPQEKQRVEAYKKAFAKCGLPTAKCDAAASAMLAVARLGEDEGTATLRQFLTTKFGANSGETVFAKIAGCVANAFRGEC